MNKSNLFTAAQFKNLISFLEKNANVDFVNVDLNDDSFISKLDWQKFKGKKEDVLSILMAYQRLKKIASNVSDQSLFELLKDGIHSVLQIAAISKGEFLKNYATFFKKEPITVEQFYSQALAIRAKIVIQYVKTKQASEPHLNKARINMNA